MTAVSTNPAQSGRVHQKRRTRDHLIAAARSLIAEQGVAPTVAQAASAASISRTTAYRYFPNQKALLIAAHPETITTSLIPPGVEGGAEERLVIAVRAFHRLIIDTESQQRTMLLLSLQSGTGSDLPLRQGRAIAWFEDALAPLGTQLSESEIHWLATAIRSAVGIEALVWLTDVAGLTHAQAEQLMQWSAQALLHEAVAGGLPRAPLVDPQGPDLRLPIWFQEVPEAKQGKNRLHVDLYPTGRDNTLPLERRIEVVEAKVAELVGLGASVVARTQHQHVIAGAGLRVEAVRQSE